MRKISQRRINKAHTLLAKAEQQKAKEEDERKKRIEIYAKERRDHEENLKGLAGRYVNEMVLIFKETNKPKFSKNEQVILNWYAPSNSWEGNLRSNLSHVDEKLGPIYLIVSEPWVDTAYIYEFIDECDRHDLFTKGSLATYRGFAERLDQLRKTRGAALPWLGWEYSFRAIDDKIKLPTYGLRETNFIKIGTPEAKFVKDLWLLEVAKDEAQEKINELRKQVEQFQSKSKALAKMSSNFYVGL